ncbi:Cleavage stimulation factor subunit 2 [Coemansia thaxteri]|nr:Cleavage stimulation factor subunit 2 [Coemansia thaxteri]
MDHFIEGQEGNVVFLGNVGFDTSEEQLKKMLELAGPVVDIRLVFDPMSNRSRGFGFCQFVDSGIAASAIKNLNDSVVDGRNIKIGFADRDRVQRYFGTDGTRLGGSLRPGLADSMTPTTPSYSGGKQGMEKVARLIDSLDAEQKAEFLAQFRSFAGVNTTKARMELVRNPGLAYALQYTLESFESADQSTRLRARRGSAEHRSPGLLPRQPAPGYSPSSMRQPPLSAGPAPMTRSALAGSQDSPRMQSSHALQQSPPSAPSSLDSQRQALSATPSQPAPASAEMELDNTEVLKQLLSLTDEQLLQLPEEHRQQIIDLKRQLESA